MHKKNLRSFFFISLIFYSCFLKAQIITTYAGNGTPTYAGDGGPATSASFNDPIGIAIDAAGNIYVADLNNNRIRKINKTTGIISTVAGNGTAGFSGDGGLAVSASLNNPSGVCVDNAGNIYIADDQNFRIRKVDAVTGIINTIAGNGTGNYNSGSLAINTGMSYPSGIASDAAGNIYFSQYPSAFVCKIDVATGIVNTLAGIGSAGFSGDGGPAINASFNYPSGLNVDASGNIFIADLLNNRIREIVAATGIITTIAGNGNAGFGGDGGLSTAAVLNNPTGVFADAAGNIFITDRGNDRVRKINASTGIINTIAGIGNYGFGGDGGSPTGPCVKLADPHKVVTDATGNIYFTDQSNSRVRKIDTTTNLQPQPIITISVSENNICAGTPIKFTATVLNPGSNLVYQWQQNGMNVGINDPTYAPALINNNDVITCQLSSTVCTVTTVTSNSITMIVGTNTSAGVTISANQTTICDGAATNVTFTATPSGGGSAPSYQWNINGNDQGVNNAVFTINTLNNGDMVQCIMTSNSPCTTNPIANSNIITMSVGSNTPPSVSIVDSPSASCPGSLTRFTATAINAGNNPVYQWQVNGINAGTNSPIFYTSTLKNGDAVACLITSNAACFTNANALSNIIIFETSSTQIPSVTIVASSSTICAGTAVTFTASVFNTTGTPSYQWYINNIAAGGDSNVFISNFLNDNDVISCTLINKNSTCTVQVVSANNITMVVLSSPVINIIPSDTSILFGKSVQIIATVEGDIANSTWTPSTSLSNTQILNPVASPTVSTTYQLAVTLTNGCQATAKSVINISKKILMPDAFTPNANGHNDVFRIPPGSLFTLIDFSVFDRWGNKVFTTSDINTGWTGTSKGGQCSAGTYVYMISGSFENKPVVLKGTVILIR